MKFFKRLKEQREVNHEAAMGSQALLGELDRTESDVDDLHKVALKQLKAAELQAKRLKDADRRNHYSEGLTKSFQERTA